jgi:hypothetical protein
VAASTSVNRTSDGVAEVESNAGVSLRVVAV